MWILNKSKKTLNNYTSKQKDILRAISSDGTSDTKSINDMWNDMSKNL